MSRTVTISLCIERDSEPYTYRNHSGTERVELRERTGDSDLEIANVLVRLAQMIHPKAGSES